MSRVPDRVPPGPIKLTYEDYVDLPDDGRRYEILDGELEVSPAPAPRHQAVLGNLLWILHGIRHYWVVDPDARLLEVYELESAAYRLVVKHEGATRLRTALFPELEIGLDRVWA